MSDEYMTKGRKEQELKDQEAKRTAEIQMHAAREISVTLSKALEEEVGKLYHVLGALNQSTQHFCHVTDQQGKALEKRVEDLTKALKSASDSSTWVGIGLIFAGLGTVVMAVLAYVK